MTDVMAALASDALVYKPRLFTLYGLIKDGLDNPEFLGWGMDFKQLGKTLYYCPAGGDTHTADNPDQLLTFHQRFAEVRLEWLDPE